MPKIEEFYPSRASRSNDRIYNKRWSASETLTLDILAHFSHFRHF
jgi:hypothetical protein